MTINEIIEQVKQLSPAERRELSQQLQAMDDEHWTAAELAEMVTTQPSPQPLSRTGLWPWERGLNSGTRCLPLA